jgi:hypothetical protein
VVPLALDDPAGRYRVTIQDLLSGASADAAVVVN